MNMKCIEIGRLTCDCIYTASPRISYILTPVRLDNKYLEQWSERYGTTVISVHGMDWDDDLTPWPAPGAEIGDADFKGQASEFLSFLRTAVIPQVEVGLHEPHLTERTLIGISLSGLFALWAWINGDDFTHIGSVSGSFWYDGFTDWLEHTAKPHKNGRAYLSLGDKEGTNGNPRFRTVVPDTARVLRTLQQAGIVALYETTAGTHFAPIYPRIEKAIEGLTIQKPAYSHRDYEYRTF